MSDQTNLPVQSRASRPPLAAGASLNAIIPTTIEETFRLAEAVHQSGLAPESMKTPQAITVAIMTGLEVGMKPMQAIGTIAVINGRPTIWGDGLIAIVRQSPLCEYVREWIEGEGDEMVAYCETHRHGEPEPVRRSFSAKDAMRAGLWQTEARVKRRSRDGGTYEKDNDSPWFKYPQRMLQMRARSWCLRDVYPDVTKGMQMREEVQDYEMRDVTPERAAPRTSGLAARLAGNTNGDGFKPRQIEAEPEHDPETGEIIEHEESPRKAVEAGGESAGMLVERPELGCGAGEGQPSETAPITGGISGANVSGSERAGVTAGETAPDEQQDLSLGDAPSSETETAASGNRAAAGEAEGAGDPPSAGSLPDILAAYGAFLWRTAHIDKLEEKAKEFWKDRADQKPEKGSPAAGLFGEIMTAHKQRQAVGPDETKKAIADVVERGRAA